MISLMIMVLLLLLLKLFVFDVIESIREYFFDVLVLVRRRWLLVLVMLKVPIIMSCVILLAAHWTQNSRAWLLIGVYLFFGVIMVDRFVAIKSKVGEIHV